jgi:putative transposase
VNSPKEHANFITITCLEWKHVLADNSIKDIIIDSLRFLVKSGRVHVFVFCIMSNHIHMIWQMLGDYKKEDVQRDFLKYTAQKILKMLRKMKSSLLDELCVHATDRKYQVWERNALSIPVYTDEVFMQKVDYIHNNPVKAGLCKYPEEYHYSSAAFYLGGDVNFDFLVHYDG